MKHGMIQTEKWLKYLPLSSDNLDKYEYLTGEDLGFNTNTAEQARFEYSQLGNLFNRGLKEKAKKKRTFKETEKY